MSKYVLFSPIGDHDPINLKDCSEGSMLHIVRHYQPEVVVLFLTKEMQAKDKKDDRYVTAIRKINKTCIIKKFKSEIENPHDFDAFIEYFSKIISKIKKAYPEHEILLNTSSGTPQIKSNLILEAITSSIKLTPIQVETPAKSSNTNKDDFLLSFLDKSDEKKEEENKRCFVPQVISFKKSQITSQIKSLLDSYEYNAAIKLLEKSNIGNLYDENVLKLLKHSWYRLNLEFEKAKICYDFPIGDIIFEYFYTVKIKQLKGELADFSLKLTPMLTELIKNFTDKEIPIDAIIEKKKFGQKEIPHITRNKLTDYDNRFGTKILEHMDKALNSEYKDQFVNFTTLLNICGYFNKNKYVDNSKTSQEFKRVFGLFKSFDKFERMIRNATAHEMVGISEDMVKESSGTNSKGLLTKLENILILEHNFKKNYLVYDEINNHIKEIL